MVTAAQAQPAAAGAAGTPLPVVCIAADAASLQPLAERAQRPLLAAGGRQVLQVGVGFVVDRERQHVLTAWHTATACPDGAGVGIVETAGGERFVTAAERLPDRNYQDASGRPVKLVQAVCRDAARPCGADLPRSAGEAPPGEALRRQQRDNVRSYAPDLAVLRLLAPARSAPLGLAVADTLDDQMRVQIRGASLTAPAPVFDAVYTGPQQISWLPEGGQPEDRIHARLHRLAAAVPAGLAGSPVLRGSGVVGLLSALDDAGDGGPPQVAAVPATVMAAFLVLLKVPYVAAVADPLRPAVSSLPPPALPSQRPWTADPQRLMLAGAAALAVLAAIAFALLARRNARQPLPQLPLPPLAPGPSSVPPSRSSAGRAVNPTLLHAVAAPTAALAPHAPGPQAHLHGSHGPLGGSLFSLPMPNGGSQLYVGRDPQACQVVFPAAAHDVSAVHACFAWEPATGLLSLSDLSSSGTWVNGRRLPKGQQRLLHDGDRVDLGGPDSNRFTVEIPSAAAEPEAPR
jgi:hypothetical protein